jgi:hypothetical protein
MTDADWLSELRIWTERAVGDDDPAEQVALGVQELLEGVSDDEIRRAYLETDGKPGDPFADALADECERRGLDI